MTTTTTRRLMPVLAALLTAGALTTSGSATSPKFLNDDPMWQEPDTQDASGMKADEVNLFVDLTYNLITGAGAGARPRAATSTPSTRCRTRAGSPIAPACGR